MGLIHTRAAKANNRAQASLARAEAARLNAERRAAKREAKEAVKDESEINALQAENERLMQLCIEAGVDPTPPEPEPSALARAAQSRVVRVAKYSPVVHAAKAAKRARESTD
jgi:hypothetical protein